MGLPLPIPAPTLLVQAPAESGGLAVSGVGTVLAKPDQVRLTLSVVTKNKDATAAAKANATRLDAVLRTLRKFGVVEKDIQTNGLEVSTDKLNISTISNSVEVFVRDLKKLGRLIDTSLSAGANGVSSLTFEAKDPAALYDEALRRAIADARRKARVMSAAVNAPIELLTITEGFREDPFSSFVALKIEPPAYSLSVPNRLATPITPGKIKVEASVTLRYRFTDAPQREKE
ncbi:MAG: SIMPL domain-containing protein [Armatimonas sp.]